MKYFITVIFLVTVFSAFTILSGGQGTVVANDGENDQNVASLE